MTIFRYIQLTPEELILLKPLYEQKCCPKKCSVGEKRIWFIPENILFTMENIEYTCCLYCFYNNTNMNLLNGKYKREQLIPILCEDLDCNCDEGTEIDSVMYKLSDGFLLGIYESGNDSKFLKLNKVSNNEFNIYFNKQYTENISITLYKTIKDDENNILDTTLNKVIYVKLKYNNPNKKIYDIIPSLTSKSYLYNNEFSITLTELCESFKENKIYKQPIKFIFNKTNKHSITIEYSNIIDIYNKNTIEINFINNKFMNELNDNNLYIYRTKTLLI